MSIKGLLLAVLVLLLPALVADAAEVRGVVTRVDPAKKEVVLEGRGRGARGMTFTFQVDKDTRILFGQEAGDLAMLAPGKHVRVFFEHRPDRDVVTLIQAHTLLTAVVPVAPPSSDNAVTGILRRVAYTEREIVVVGPGAKGAETETTFPIGAGVRITRGDKAISFDDLREGEQVAVMVEKQEGKEMAVALQVGGGTPVAPIREARLQRFMEVVQRFLQMMEAKRGER